MKYVPGVIGIALDGEIKDRNLVGFWINQTLTSIPLYANCGCTILPYTRNTACHNFEHYHVRRLY